MGRQKKGYNWRARESAQGSLTGQDEVDRLQGKINIAGQSPSGLTTSDSNTLALPSKKRTMKKQANEQMKGKLLSRKRRKLLERIVDQKRKKEQRGDLYEKLRSVQVDDTELNKLSSVSMMQTKGLKRQIEEAEFRAKVEREAGSQLQLREDPGILLNPVKKPRLSKVLLPKPERKQNEEGQVLGFSESSSSEEEDEGEEVEVQDESEKEALEEEAEEGASKPTVEENVQEKQRSEAELKPAVADTARRKTSLAMPSSEPKAFVPVIRLPQIQESREKLPILGEEQAIVEAINEHPVVILAGETGSGKTTQVPQFLYEAGYTTRRGQLIGVTEPRRVAAMAMAKRVGEELNGAPDLVSYQIRFEGNMTAGTQIKFMTDGVLLREMAKDFRLRKYSVIVLDEAHERSVFTDILIGNLSRIVPLRAKDEENGPLKLVIMSATLRIEDFTENQRLFKGAVPPVIKVESRQFDTTCHFQRETPDDYLAAALKKTCKIHKELPEGGILVFVTGQHEVNQLVRKLRKLFPAQKQLPPKKSGEEDGDREAEENLSRIMVNAAKARRRKSKGRSLTHKEKLAKQGKLLVPTVDLNDFSSAPLDDTENDAARGSDDDSEDGDGSLELLDSLATKYGAASQPMWTLPLYSLLNSEKQAKIFDPPPAGHRLCVVATNIAETSLTIPGIKYVVDTGKVKTKFYDKLTGVTTFAVTWASKAAANQRAGRAGRQGPGHCYRLFSSEVFKNEFPLHAPAEIVRRPVEDLVLQMKAMKIINVTNFPFPTPPDAAQLHVAERRLFALGALQHDPDAKKYHVSELGQSMAAFPLAPCFSKMLALSAQHGLMPYTIAMVAALSVQEVLMETPVGQHVATLDKEQVMKIRRIWAGRGNSFLLGDPMVLLKAVGAGEHDALSHAGDISSFCDKYALRRKAMLEIRKLRRQLTNEVNLILPDMNLPLDPSLRPPSDEQCLLLRQIVLAGMVNNVAQRMNVDEEVHEPKERHKFRLAYRTRALKEPVFLHAKTVFANTRKSGANLPQWIVYQEIFETAGKMYLRGVTAIEEEWLSLFAPNRHFGMS